MRTLRLFLIRAQLRAKDQTVNPTVAGIVSGAVALMLFKQAGL